MGEAKRRAERRREAGEPVVYSPAVPRFRTRTLNIPMPVEQEIQRELKLYRRRYSDGTTISTHDYIIALLEASVERERQAREAAEAAAKPEPMVRLASHVPAGMEGVAEKLQALKTGTMPAKELVRG